MATGHLTNDSAQTRLSDVEYVVQVKEDAIPMLDDGSPSPGEHDVFWRDVATVKVPPNTRTKTALRLGLDEAGIEITPELEARVLDADAAYIWTAKPPEPKSLRLT